MTKNETTENTRERILDEAEILFARRGYQAVSIREIIQAAHCNLAAVNYHFGQKKNLYLEVFRSRLIPRAKRVQAAFWESLHKETSHSVDTIVRTLTEAFIHGPLTEEERYLHNQLMAREQAEPSEALELIIREVMQPFFTEIAHLLHQVLPEKVEKDTLRLSLLSMFSQILYFSFARAAVTRITGREYDDDFKAILADHIVRFCLHGLGTVRREDK
ncbi:MAG: CerR family C-terminal domain-containing protein [Deltaproteobacteria bacterium]|nr:CerR family C-terminal domain-containing protein [Deltaproteobacteria bacterium]